MEATVSATRELEQLEAMSGGGLGLPPGQVAQTPEQRAIAGLLELTFELASQIEPQLEDADPVRVDAATLAADARVHDSPAAAIERATAGDIPLPARGVYLDLVGGALELDLVWRPFTLVGALVWTEPAALLTCVPFGAWEGSRSDRMPFAPVVLALPGGEPAAATLSGATVIALGDRGAVVPDLDHGADLFEVWAWQSVWTLPVVLAALAPPG
jgi:hypothetical protein